MRTESLKPGLDLNYYCKAFRDEGLTREQAYDIADLILYQFLKDNAPRGATKGAPRLGYTKHRGVCSIDEYERIVMLSVLKMKIDGQASDLNIHAQLLRRGLLNRNGVLPISVFQIRGFLARYRAYIRLHEYTSDAA